MRTKLTTGRATVTALSLVSASLLLGGVMLSRHAKAQEPAAPLVRITTFGPAQLAPTTNNSNISALIGLLLPAVQHEQSPFVLEIMNEDTDLRVPVVPASTNANTVRNNVFFRVFTTATPGTALLELHILNERNREEHVVKTGFANVTVRLLPAVQSNGNVVEPFADSTTIQGSNTVAMADGSVLPIPFAYALPAVQNEIMFAG